MSQAHGKCVLQTQLELRRGGHLVPILTQAPNLSHLEEPRRGEQVLILIPRETSGLWGQPAQATHPQSCVPPAAPPLTTPCSSRASTLKANSASRAPTYKSPECSLRVKVRKSWMPVWENRLTTVANSVETGTRTR